MDDAYNEIFGDESIGTTDGDTTTVICTNCGSEAEFVADQRTGDYICGSCGFIHDEIIDTGREWRSFETDAESGVGDRARADVVDEDFSSLGTGIASTNFNSSSESAAAKSLQKYSRFGASEETRVENYLREAFAQMNNLAETLHMPIVVRQAAKEIIRKFESIEREKRHRKKARPAGTIPEKEDRTFCGLRTPAFFAAILLLASRNEQGGSTLKTVSKGTQIDLKEIKHYYKILLRNPLIANLGRREDVCSNVNQIQEHIEVFGNKLKLPYNIIKDAKEVGAFYADFTEGKRPSSIAAASLLLMLYLRRQTKLASLKDVLEASQVHGTTVRSVYRTLLLKVHELPKHLIDPNE